ncbi:MAG: hypothetical protein LBJ12_02850 [Oscillospiraceae bacterium]|jgi:hypothetical protein|nr:hypothetical protein [Oscillospiraceae bacterium]
MMEWLPAHINKENYSVWDILCDELIFGDGGIARIVHPIVRGALWFLVDDGWDLRSSQGRSISGERMAAPAPQFLPDERRKFPGLWQNVPGTLENPLR